MLRNVNARCAVNIISLRSFAGLLHVADGNILEVVALLSADNYVASPIVLGCVVFQ